MVVLNRNVFVTAKVITLQHSLHRFAQIRGALKIRIIIAWLGLISPSEAFSGFASNAVIAIMGVMILSYGMDRSGVMNRLTRLVMRLAGSSEKKLLLLVSGTLVEVSNF